jgi:hypothetical protein
MQKPFLKKSVPTQEALYFISRLRPLPKKFLYGLLMGKSIHEENERKGLFKLETEVGFSDDLILKQLITGPFSDDFP